MILPSALNARLASPALLLASSLLLGACAGAGTLPATATATIGVLDLSCKTAADCSIKDVGSCCGYQPRCLNKDSATYAEQVKAKCAEEGRVSHCGMPTVTGCACQAGKCTNLGAADAGLVH